MPNSRVAQPVTAAGARVSARGWGWRHASRRAHAVKDVTFDIEPGERILLLGRSGAGKSTLVHALAGVLGGDDEGERYGELLLDGRPPSSARGEAGLVLQDPDSQVILARVGDDVAFACENLGIPRDEIWRRVGVALDAVGLDLPLDHPTSMLSGGQKQRLALAGIIAMRPRLLLLDEPTANLDPAGVGEVRGAVSRMLDASGATLVVIEHRVDIWRDVVDRVIVLDPHGGLLADGSPADVFDREGETLSAAGVWVPGFPPRRPTRALRDRVERTPLLAASGLAVGRAEFGHRRPRVVNEGIAFDVSAGDAMVISGPNGSGKSTLALTMAGLIAPAAGSLTASTSLADGLGVEPHRWKSRDLLTRVGTVFQDPEHQFLAATVRDELAVGPKALALTSTEVAERVDELVTRLRLDHLIEANPFTLSGGEKRRLSVATVLATRPQLLVLDEPTFGQDFRTWEELVMLLAELLDAGTAMVAVTHDREFQDALAESVLALNSPTGTKRPADTAIA